MDLSAARGFSSLCDSHDSLHMRASIILHLDACKDLKKLIPLLGGRSVLTFA